MTPMLKLTPTAAAKMWRGRRFNRQPSKQELEERARLAHMLAQAQPAMLGGTLQFEQLLRDQEIALTQAQIYRRHFASLAFLYND